MNLHDATVDDWQLRFANGDTLPLPRQFRDCVAAGQEVVFGLRPDDLYPVGHGIHSGEEGEVHTRSVPVLITEPLGNETLIFSQFAGADWIARMLNPRIMQPGDRVELAFDLSQAHLFDAGSE